MVFQPCSRFGNLLIFLLLVLAYSYTLSSDWTSYSGVRRPLFARLTYTTMHSKSPLSSSLLDSLQLRAPLLIAVDPDTNETTLITWWNFPTKILSTAFLSVFMITTVLS